MNRRLIRRLPLALLLLVATGALLHGCASEDPPSFENPLDPRNPGSVDPFQLTAEYAAGRVTLEWVVPEGPAIDQIVIESLVSGQPSDLDTVTVDVTEYVDTEPRGNTENYYRLRAIDANGFSAQNSQVVAAPVFVPPVIELSGGTLGPTGGLQISTALQDITVRAEAGQVAQFDTLRDFSQALTAPVVDGEAVFPQFRILAPRTEGGFAVPRRILHTRVGLVDAQDTVWVSVDSLGVDLSFRPTFSKDGGGNTVAAPSVDIALTSGGTGVEQLRFAHSRSGLADAAWLPPTDVVEDVPLRDTPGPQHLFVQYFLEFGYSVIPDSITLRGDPLTSARFDLVLPESGYVEGRTVGVEPAAVATEMRFSTSLGFEGASWQAYTDSLGVTLRDEPGPQQLYAQFRNHWFISSILSEEVLLSAAVLEPEITAPLAGDPVRAGSLVLVEGVVAEPDSGYALTRLEVHLGAGWQDLPPDTTWTANWTVPEGFDVDSPWQLGVRATAEDPNADDVIQGVDWIEVLITQLTLHITDPENGDEITTGEPVTISGTASPDLTGPELERIVVEVAGTTLETTETLTGWSVTWEAEAVSDTTAATISATVYAGDESLQRSVDVTLLPPEPEEEE